MDIKEFTDKLRASRRTKEVYAGYITRFLEWAEGRELDEDLAQAYIDYLEKKGRKPNTLATVANALRAYWKVQKKEISLNAPSPSFGEPKYHEIEKIMRMLELAATPFEKVLVTVLFDTGARVSEVMNLEIPNIDWKVGFIHVTLKGGHEGDYLISKKGITALKDWLEVRKSNDPRVFMDYNYYYAYTVLKKLAKKAGIKDFTPHHLRHSFAFYCKSQGVELHDLQQFLQHRSMNTTATFYGRSRPEHLRPKKPGWGEENNNQPGAS